jgi:hypothetical protein
MIGQAPARWLEPGTKDNEPLKTSAFLVTRFAGIVTVTPAARAAHHRKAARGRAVHSPDFPV